MIYATELRIGNTVLFDQDVDNIKSLGERMASGTKHSHWYYERLHPITLTTKLLVDVGFSYEERWDNDYVYGKGYVAIRQILDEF